ncbi:M4 family metallopeptidase [Streptomyces sp. A7024]|uniref:M4 family metallopeptidase n=2 Tax=Streptomyces coryli TaxID=1128680 RepID=A0A6G4U1F3_9ACTN|nr:M4 family metallopeptidase [Streptomyces coryli]NGN65913.1 M4 family metallopeptidase [Streptomyces coryli]
MASLAACTLAAGLAGALGTATAAAEEPPPEPPSGKAAAVAASDRAAFSGLDGLRHGPDEDLVRTSVQPWANGLYFSSYETTYRGLDVDGADAVVVADGKGRVRDVAAAKAPLITVGTKAKVAKAAAEATARKQLAKVEKATAPELTVLIDEGKKALLTWRTTVTGSTAAGKPSVLRTYVDAASGKVAEAREQVRDATGHGYHNGDVTIDTSGSGTSHRMVDPTRSGLQCGGQNGTAYTGTDAVWGNGGGTNLETACVDVMYAAQREFDMLKEWLGRNGQDGQGGMVPARVGLNQVNAFYDGTKTNYGHNQANTEQATPIDVVAHEYGHNIFDRTPGSAGSSNENGGLNESTGDIFGALTEAYANNANDAPDYLVGEMVDLVGQGPIRNMYNPGALGDPNCYPQLSSGTEVHAAAGPQNHWFYLLAEGSSPGGGKPNSPICSGGPSSVTGIGIQKAGKIFMGALMMKTSSWNHAAARKATLSVAKNTYGATECNAVKAAWNAIAMPAQSGETDCGGTATDDFSMSLNPTSGSVQPGSSATSTVGTTTTQGAAQTVALSATGQPSGVTVSFAPASVTSGASSTMTVAVAAGAANGSYPITVKGTGKTSHSVTYTLTVGSGGPSGCSSSEATYQGTLADGQSEVQPDGSYYYSGSSGQHIGCLRGPSGTDFDLYLQKWSGSGWATVRESTSADENEDITYSGTAGYYRYVVDAYSGSGAYTLGLTNP